MLEAHTQHREKIAIEIIHIADVYTKSSRGEENTTLEEVPKAGEHGASKERALLKSSIKSLGLTRFDI